MYAKVIAVALVLSAVAAQPPGRPPVAVPPGPSWDASVITSGEFPDERVSDEITISSGGHVDGGSIDSGTISPARLPDEVALMGNDFNGADQLLRIDPDGKLPALDGSKLTNVFPPGGIIMWHGTIATIPRGWALCNGQNGTPDLRNRFIVGAEADSNGTAMTSVKGTPMQTGGQHQVTLSVDEMPKHTHSGTVSIAGKAGDANAHDYDPHRVWPAGGSGSAGGSQPHENCPPFYALAFIMRLP